MELENEKRGYLVSALQNINELQNLLKGGGGKNEDQNFKAFEWSFFFGES